MGRRRDCAWQALQPFAASLQPDGPERGSTGGAKWLLDAVLERIRCRPGAEPALRLRFPHGTDGQGHAAAAGGRGRRMGTGGGPRVRARRGRPGRGIFRGRIISTVVVVLVKLEASCSAAR